MKKKTMILSTLFAVALAMTGCSDNDNDIKYAPDTETVTISQSTLNISKDGGDATVNVQSTHEFTAYTNESWITVTPETSISKKASLSISVSANGSSEQRTGSVIIWSGGTRDSIKIVQEAGKEDVITSPIAGYSLVWNDEFTGKELGGSWTYEVQPAGWVNDEKQTYVKGDGVTEVSNGTLKINLKKDGDLYKSARIYANKSTGWKYCYIEASIKLPKGKGTWPAFWMMPVTFNTWPGDGEIDIMEEVGYDPNVAVSTIHCNKYNNGGTAIESARTTVSTGQDEFHKYAMEWTATYMKFFVDDKLLLTYNNDGTGKDAWPFDAAFYPILNLAWGGAWGGVQGTDDSVLPATMEVDYVRVFQK